MNGLENHEHLVCTNHSGNGRDLRSTKPCCTLMRKIFLDRQYLGFGLKNEIFPEHNFSAHVLSYLKISRKCIDSN